MANYFLAAIFFAFLALRFDIFFSEAIAGLASALAAIAGLASVIAGLAAAAAGAAAGAAAAGAAAAGVAGLAAAGAAGACANAAVANMPAINVAITFFMGFSQIFIDRLRSQLETQGTASWLTRKRDGLTPN